AVSALVVGGVTAFFLLRNTSPINFPDSIGGVPMQTSPIAQGLIEGMNREATIAGHAPKSAIYGSERAPSFLVLVYDFATPGEVDAFFSGGAAGFARSARASVDLTSK